MPGTYDRNWLTKSPPSYPSKSESENKEPYFYNCFFGSISITNKLLRPLT